MGRRHRGPPKISGLLIVDKPTGMTSHDVVAQVRRRVGERQVGHAGTLDPMATGVLVVAVGRATRLCRFVEATDKRYLATVKLGAATDTYDSDGTVVAEAPVPELSDREVSAALADLTGENEQQVPAYSAVKVDGQRLHKLARRGEEVRAPTRTVTITSLSPTRIELPEIDIDVGCSKGTYIRSLAVQIGERLGVPAHLSAIRRTAVGCHHIDDAVPLDAIDAETPLLPMPVAVGHLQTVRLSDGDAEGVKFGRAPSRDALRDAGLPALPPQTPVAVLGGSGDLLAVGFTTAPDHPEEDHRGLKYACVLV